MGPDKENMIFRKGIETEGWVGGGVEEDVLDGGSGGEGERGRGGGAGVI